MRLCAFDRDQRALDLGATMDRRSQLTVSSANVSVNSVRRTTKSADFCGRGLVDRQNRPTKLVNRDTRPIFSSATSYDIS